MSIHFGKFQFLVAMSLLAVPLASFAEDRVRPAASAVTILPEIDRVELEGVIAFDQASLEKVLEISAGDRLDRGKVLRSAKNIQELYHIHGYEQVQIRSLFGQQPVEEKQEKPRSLKASENTVKFIVNEGLPTRVASFELFLDGKHDAAFSHFWKNKRAVLSEKFGLRPGEVFDQQKVIAGKKAIQDDLAADEFIGVRVDDVRITTENHVNSRWVNLPTARWVKLEIHLDIGERVSFGFRGNTVFTYAQLTAIVDEQRLLGFGRDYVARIQSKIEEGYKNLGYARVLVNPFTFENPEKQERHVTYQIEEGNRLEIATIQFDGNLVFNGNQLREQLLSRSSPLVQKRIYVGKDVEKSAELLIEWLKSQGYLGAKLVTINRIFLPGGKSVQLTFYLYEGEQTLTRSLTLNGVHAFKKNEVEKFLGVSEGGPLNLFAFSEGLETLKAAYRARGYLEARITNEGAESVVRYTKENREADILIEISEGYQYRLSHIDIEGLSGTREDVVTREIVLAPGDVLEEAKLLQIEANLRRLGIFSLVTIRTVDDPEKRDHRILKVLVQEGTPGVVSGGVGFRNDLGVRIFGQTAYTNFWHRNHTLSLTATANRRFLDKSFCSHGQVYVDGHDQCFIEYQVELGYVWPWFMLGNTTFTPKITVERTQYRILDTFSTAFTATLDRQLLKTPNLFGFFTYSLERIRQSNAVDPVDNNDLNIGGITPGLRLDLRDSTLAPTRGLFATASYEIASPAFLSQNGEVPVSYTRFQFRSDYFVPVTGGITWYLSFRTGYEQNRAIPPASNPDDRRFQIPLIKQFTLGGAGSLRGFGEQELNYRDLAIRGTLAYVNYRTQLDLPFAGPLRFGPFLDAGNLLVDRYSLGILRYGAGAGLHYQSPVGPVNFDWGFKLFRKPGEEADRFYFSIGVI
ncbi:MAG: BamA/TamA family outer membrane protein [Methylotenera sp.]|nr:BamA/TamA family outer membrane protein [Oligoflexia bacterium]